MTNQVLTREPVKTDNVVHLHDKLQVDLVQVQLELFDFAVNNYGGTIAEKINAILYKTEVSEELKKRISTQLIWWIIFHEPSNTDGSTIFARYVKLNGSKWQGKSTSFHQILESWRTILPGFYMTTLVGKSKRVGSLVNVIGLKQYMIAVYNKAFQSLKQDELLVGFLLPIGDNTYTSPVDLFHISVSDAPKMTWDILLHFHQHINASKNQANPTTYLSLLIAAFEAIEKNNRKSV